MCTTTQTPQNENHIKNIKWTISGGFCFFDTITGYIHSIKQFYNFDHYIIDTVHDCPPGIIWSGGRIPTPDVLCIDHYVKLTEEYNSIGIGVNLILSNTLLEQKHLDDDLCNYLLQSIENPLNGVILASSLLNNYIQDTYPKFKRIASICNVNKDYNQLLKEYDLVILQPDDNRNTSILNEIDDLNRIEILVNESCVPNCKFRRDHYNKTSKKILFGNQLNKHHETDCISESQGRTNKNELYLTQDEIQQLYAMGIKHFKIQGRQRSAQYIIETMRSYIERPLITYYIKNNP